MLLESLLFFTCYIVFSCSVCTTGDGENSAKKHNVALLVFSGEFMWATGQIVSGKAGWGRQTDTDD